LINNSFRQIISKSDEQAYTLPFLSYPSKLDCLGLMPMNPKAIIEEGYIRMSYDFDIYEADKECLFPSTHW
jgi:hypothetical protein